MLLPANGGVSIERAGGSSNLAAVASLCVGAFVDLPTGPASLTMAELVEQWEQQLAGRLERPQHALLIARREEAETPIGCVELGLLPPPPTRPGADVPYMANVAVLPQARREGIGRLLVSAGEALAMSWGYEDLYCRVDRPNFDARRLYDRAGFRPIFLQQSKPDWRNKQKATIFLVKELGGDQVEEEVAHS